MSHISPCVYGHIIPNCVWLTVYWKSEEFNWVGLGNILPTGQQGPIYILLNQFSSTSPGHLHGHPVRHHRVEGVRLGICPMHLCPGGFEVSLLSHDNFIDFQRWEMRIIPRPSSFFSMYLVVLSTTEGLLSDKKSSNSLSISLICVTVRLGMTVAICVNLGIHSVLITVIFPNTVKCLCRQELSSFLTLPRQVR